MGRTTIALLLCCAAFAGPARAAPEGRWEGVIHISGNDQPVVVDLAPSSTGEWTGSIILTGLGIKGAPLSNMRQAGNVADLSLRRIGPAQVELPVKSTAVGNDIAREWSGEFELGGYPRQVTIKLQNHANAAATATFVIIGKRRTTSRSISSSRTATT